MNLVQLKSKHRKDKQQQAKCCTSGTSILAWGDYYMYLAFWSISCSLFWSEALCQGIHFRHLEEQPGRDFCDNKLPNTPLYTSAQNSLLFLKNSCRNHTSLHTNQQLRHWRHLECFGRSEDWNRRISHLPTMQLMLINFGLLVAELQATAGTYSYNAFLIFGILTDGRTLL